MEVSVTKKTNRYAALATYLVAIVCLLLGLFLPLFDGKGILALQLPQALNSLANKEIVKFGKDFTFVYPVYFFGQGKPIDFMALIVLLYAAVTALGLLALIPIGISVNKDGKSYCVFMRIIETAAVFVLSLYVIIALEWCGAFKISYNMLIAFGGSLLMLIVLCFMTKGKAGVAKFFLLLLSAITFLSLFNFAAIVPKLEEPLLKFADKLKFTHLFVRDGESGITGIAYLAVLFEGMQMPLISEPENPAFSITSYFDVLKGLPETKYKALMVLLTVVALVAVVNYFIDVLALSTNGKRAGLLFNIVRYGVEFLALIALVITVIAAKSTFGLMLILFAIALLLQVLISILRYVFARKKAASIAAEEAEETITFAKPPKHVRHPHTDEEIIIERKPVVEVNEPKRATANNVPPAIVDMEVVEKPVKVAKPEPEVEVIKAPEQQTIDSIINEKQAENKEQSVDAGNVETVKSEVKKDEPENVHVREVKVEPIQDVKPEPVREVKVEPVQEVKPNPEPVREVKAEPVQEVTAEPTPSHSASGNVYIVGQSSDEFIKKLTNEEKLEFTRTFIEKLNGNLGSVPDYIIGGDNRKFFSSVFIYLGRLRGMISDNLLNKMYKELNML